MRALTIGAAGALFLIGGCATPGQLPQRLQLAVTMTGVQAVPGPGDPAMTGRGQVRVNTRTGELCWDIYARGGTAASAAQIRRGAAGSTGPVAVQLSPPDAAGHSQGCATLDAGTRLALYYVTLIGDRRRRPREDLTSALLEARLDGRPLTDRQLIALLFLLVSATNESTGKLIGNALFHGWRLPGLARAGLDGRAADWGREALRYDSPSQMVARTLTEDTVMATEPWCVNLKALDSRFLMICCRRLASVNIDFGRRWSNFRMNSTFFDSATWRKVRET